MKLYNYIIVLLLVIFSLPQTLSAQNAYIVGPSNPNLGDTEAYSIVDPNNQIEAGSLDWGSDGSIQGPSDTTTISILWDSGGENTIEVCYDNGAGDNYCAILIVNVFVQPTISGPLAVNLGETTTYTVEDPSNAIQSINSWSSDGQIQGATNSTSVDILWTTVGTPIVELVYTDSSGFQQFVNITVNVTDPPQTTSISGPTAVNLGATTTYTLLDPNNQVASGSIDWNSTGQIQGDDNASTVNILWTTLGTKSVEVNYNDSFGNPRTLEITATVTNSQPVTISGPLEVNLGETTTYTLEDPSNYAVQSINFWSSDGEIQGTTTSTSVDILWTTEGSQIVEVDYIDSQGNQQVTNITVNVTSTPQTTSISGPLQVNLGETTTYTLQDPNNQVAAGSIDWSSDGQIQDANNTSTVSILWTTLGSKSVEVTYNDSFGNPHTVNITATVTNTQPVYISGPLEVNLGETTTYTLEDPSNYVVQSINFWSSDGEIQGTTTSTSVDILWTTEGTPIVEVDYVDSQGNQQVINITVNVTSTPQATSISGPLQVNLGETTTYTLNDPNSQVASGSIDWNSGGQIQGATNASTIAVLWTTLGAKTVEVSYNDAFGNPHTITITATVTNQIQNTSISGPLEVNLGEVNTYTLMDPEGQVDFSTIVWGGNGQIQDPNNGTSVAILWTTVGNSTVQVNYNDLFGNEHTINITVNTGIYISGPTEVNIGEVDRYTLHFPTTEVATINSWSSTEGQIQGSNTGSYVDILWTESGISTIAVNYTDASGNQHDMNIKVHVINPNEIYILGEIEPNLGEIKRYYLEDPNDEIANIVSWSPDNGQIIAQENWWVEIAWTSNGSQIVEVLYTDNSGNQHNANVTVTVLNTHGTYITGPAEVDLGDEASSYSLVDPNNIVINIVRWNYIDLIQGENNQSEVNVLWTEVGDKILEATYTDASGYEFLAYINVTVRDPQATSILGPRSASLEDISTYILNDPNGQVDSILEWKSEGQIQGDIDTSEINISWTEVGFKFVEVKYLDSSQKTHTIEIEVSVVDTFGDFEGMGGDANTYISGPKNVHLGDIENYHIVDRNNQVESIIEWTSDGEPQGEIEDEDVDILWWNVGSPIIELTYIDVYGETKNISTVVTVTIPIPTAPKITYSTNNTRLTKAEPPVGQTWYWQETEFETKTTNAATYIDRSTAGTVYLRSYASAIDQWSAARRVDYTINPSHSYSDENFIYTTAPQIETTNISTLSDDDKIENISYFDGLGRAKQGIGIRAGGNREDIITHIAYDAFGRQDKNYLPYAMTAVENNDGIYTPWALTDLGTFYETPKYENTSNPFSQKELEASPLGRVLKQAAPGQDWALGSSHEIEFSYQTNTLEDNVVLFEVTNSFVDNTQTPTIGKNGTYLIGELSKAITYDENWTASSSDFVADEKNHSTEEFKDKQGKVILKRTYNNEIPHDTYYVYDDLDNLTYVLPPKMEASTASITEINTTINELGYQYTYDHRNRLVEKKIPGKGKEYIVYNKLDQPILTQDANQRENGEWLFTKYDAFGRVAYTGKATDSRDRPAVQSDANAITGTLWVNKSSAQSFGGTTLYYDNGGYPSANSPVTTLDEVLTINYYDDYDFLASETGISLPTNAFSKTIENNDNTNKIKTKSLATGSRVKVLNTNDWIVSTSGYDDKARPIYSQSNNSFLGTVDIVQMQLDFTGRTLKSRTSHTRSGNTIVTIDNLTYDHVGRLLAQTQCIGDAGLGDTCEGAGGGDVQNILPLTGTVDIDQTAREQIIVTDANIIPEDGGDESTVLNIDPNAPSGSGGEEELIVLNIYDELGQLENKKVGGDADATNVLNSLGLQTVDYTYNIRNWLKSINNPNAMGDDLFAFGIKYNNVGNPSNRLYNGNIAQTVWNSANNALAGNPGGRNYVYNYDALNRITSATGLPGSNHNVSNITYDKNGNIQTLIRDGHTELAGNGLVTDYGVMDNLSYSYDNGNKLASVSDIGNSTYGFKDVTGTNDYDYDANGNMTQDLNKGITSGGITYNHLNLPEQISIDGGSISYVYDATGIKLQKSVSTGTVTEYAGNYIYEGLVNNTLLQFFNHQEGYVSTENGGYDHIFHYKDHLGNIRLAYSDEDGNGSIDPSTEIKEENNYYPFGLKHKGYNANSSGRNHKFGFGGKEEQEDLVNGNSLDWLDFGFRNYDASIGKWMNLDPLASLDYNFSPYTYTLNNPINLVDPDGLSTHIDEDGNIVAVYEDDDTGVYIQTAEILKDFDPKKMTLTITDDTQRIGETEYWDEFVNPETGKAMTDHRIQIGKSFDPIIAEKNKQAQDMDLIEIAVASRGDGKFDIKKDYKGVGGLLNGKYATSRSAGNYLAGLNAEGGTFAGINIPFKTFQKLAGALHIEESNGKKLSKPQMVDIVIFGIYISKSDKSKFVAPTYGEVDYQYRQSKAGWESGEKKD